MIPYKQLSLADIFSDCQEKFENDKPAFLSLLESHIEIDEIIRFLLEITSMHQRVEPVNTLYMLCCGL